MVAAADGRAVRRAGEKILSVQNLFDAECRAE